MTFYFSIRTEGTGHTLAGATKAKNYFYVVFALNPIVSLLKLVQSIQHLLYYHAQSGTALPLLNEISRHAIILEFSRIWTTIFVFNFDIVLLLLNEISRHAIIIEFSRIWTTATFLLNIRHASIVRGITACLLISFNSGSAALGAVVR